MNTHVPEEYGGPGLDFLSGCLIEEEFGWGCSGIGTSLAANGLAMTPVGLAASAAFVAASAACFVASARCAVDPAGSVPSAACRSAAVWTP